MPPTAAEVVKQRKGREGESVRANSNPMLETDVIAVGDADARPVHSKECMSALCSSLYSKFAVVSAGESFASLPFLRADDSVEARGLLEAMHEAHAKAMSAAQRDSGSGGGIGKVFGSLGALLLLLNPLK